MIKLFKKFKVKSPNFKIDNVSGDLNKISKEIKVYGCLEEVPGPLKGGGSVSLRA